MAGNIAGKRTYKDSVFRMIFGKKKELLSLYNAIFGTDYADPEELDITTLDNAVYMGHKNDISCVICFHLTLFEHQSTVNPNMPLRYLMYISDLYEKLAAKSDIYSRKQITLPSPDFIVLYNGLENQPERRVMLLSDAYQKKEKEISLELKVLQLNINEGYNEAIVSRCPVLYEYIKFVSCVRRYQNVMSVSDAVDRTVNECIENGILKEFLINNRAEVVRMSIYEYDEAKHLRTLQQESREDGWLEGREEGKKQLIYRMFHNNKTPEEVSEFTGEPVDYLYGIQKQYLEMVKEQTVYDEKITP